MDLQNVPLLESYFDFIYAEEIIDIISSVFEKMCIGCKYGYLSQLEHTCLMSTKERLEMYFDNILSEVDELCVIDKWYKKVLMISAISPSTVNMYKLKLNCIDWREGVMKTTTWKRRMIQRVLTIQKLENRFV